MALVKTIKDRNTHDTIYPITKADAVYLSDNETTVEGAINTLDNNLVIMIPTETTLTNIAADAGSNISVNLSVPTGYSLIGASVMQISGYNRFIVWVGSYNDSKVNVMYVNNRTSTLSEVTLRIIGFAKKKLII